MKILWRVCREYTKEPYSFLPIDTTLSASDLLRFRKNLLHSYKMTVTDQPRIIDNKVKANQAQYDLDSRWIFDWWRFEIQTKRI